jgi:hypothetical protein
VFNCFVRCTIGEACEARQPEELKHRYTQINTDEHRWDSAIASGRVHIAPAQYPSPVIASDAKQSLADKARRLLRVARNDGKAPWRNPIGNCINGSACAIGLKSGLFSGDRIIDLLTDLLISFGYRQPYA